MISYSQLEELLNQKVDDEFVVSTGSYDDLTNVMDEPKPKPFAIVSYDFPFNIRRFLQQKGVRLVTIYSKELEAITDKRFVEYKAASCSNGDELFASFMSVYPDKQYEKLPAVRRGWCAGKFIGTGKVAA